MNRDSRILVTGSHGMVGSAVVRRLRDQCYENLLTPSHEQLELRSQEQVDRYFDKQRPAYVMMIAAKVGGIAANSADPVGFLVANCRMELNLFEACCKYEIRKSLFLGSSCVYPRDCPQPMKEEYLLTGTLEPTNEGYALAKILGLKLAQYYYRQHGMVTVCPMPCNVYGTNDNFDLERSHVLSALVRRFVDAESDQKPEVVLWGSGTARREFIHVEDLSNAVLFLMERYDKPDIVNVGTGVDISIRDLAQMIAHEVGYRGRIAWDDSKPDGMPRKCLDISRLDAMGFRANIGLQEGIKRTACEYRQLRRAGRTA